MFGGAGYADESFHASKFVFERQCSGKNKKSHAIRSQRMYAPGPGMWIYRVPLYNGLQRFNTSKEHPSSTETLLLMKSVLHC